MWQFGVPNVPCGVERKVIKGLYKGHHLAMFLMYRVELKDSPLAQRGGGPVSVFLMYRVELKGPHPSCKSCPSIDVPNVPCGVERWRS